MKRDLEKFIAKKISDYNTNQKIKNNGIIPKEKSKLLLDFYKYTLNNSIISIYDVPNKFKEIMQ
jgi:hypothetical protein